MTAHRAPIASAWVPPITREPHAGCTDKVRYSTAAYASAAIKRIKRVSGKRLHRYRCVHCEGFHLTSTPVSVSLAWDAYNEKGSA